MSDYINKIWELKYNQKQNKNTNQWTTQKHLLLLLQLLGLPKPAVSQSTDNLRTMLAVKYRSTTNNAPKPSMMKLEMIPAISLRTSSPIRVTSLPWRASSAISWTRWSISSLLVRIATKQLSRSQHVLHVLDLTLIFLTDVKILPLSWKLALLKKTLTSKTS